jgi:WD40 domain-containing protein/WD40 repeat protein
MTDKELERRLRDWYVTEVPGDEQPPSALRSSVRAIPAAAPAARGRSRGRRGLTLLAVAALVTTAIAGGALLAGSGTVWPSVVVRPTVAPSPVLPRSSASPGVAVVVGPSPSPQRATPSASAQACLTDSVEVVTGDALPGIVGYRVKGLGQSRGVFLANRGYPRQPLLWAIDPARDSVTLIASVTPALILDVLDVSPDGSNALIRVGNISPAGSTPECADLYLVRTDGSGATRLTSFGTGRFVTGAAFSPDGRRVAYSWWAPDTITTLDLETGVTVDQPCSTVYSIWPLRIDWSPTGARFAVGCDATLKIFDPSATSAPVRFPMAEEPLAFSWTDSRQLIVASGGGNTYAFDIVSETSTIVGRFDDPAIEIVDGTGVFSPDGRWLAFHGGERGDVPGNDFTEVGYVVPSSGGTPTRIPGELVDTTWSGDSRALVYIDNGSETWRLTRIDVETLDRSTIGTIAQRPDALTYRQGVWRVP